MPSSPRLLSSLTLLLFTGCSEAGLLTSDRQPLFCDGSWRICGQTAGCLLDEQHYVEASFPGAQTLALELDGQADLELLLHVTELRAAGTSLQVQLRGPDCLEIAGDPALSERAEDLEDLDTLILPLPQVEEGDHLLEIYSDASFDAIIALEDEFEESTVQL